MSGDLREVANKIVQKAIHSNSNLSTPISHAQQSLTMAGAMHRANNGGCMSIKDQLFPSSRKRRRAAKSLQRKENK